MPMQPFVRRASLTRENTSIPFDLFLSITAHRIAINIRDMYQNVQVTRVPRRALFKRQYQVLLILDILSKY